MTPPETTPESLHAGPTIPPQDGPDSTQKPSQIKRDETLQSRQIRNAFEKMYGKYGHRFISQFRYAIYHDKVVGIPPQQPNPLAKPLEILSHQEARKLVKKTPWEPEKKGTKAFRTYRAGRILALKKTVEDDLHSYQWEIHPPQEEENLLGDLKQKILWPERQKKALASLLRLGLSLGIRHTSQTLGERPPPFLTLCQVLFYEEDFTRAVISYGANKKEANYQAKKEATLLWKEDPEVQSKQERYEKKTLTCLTLWECKKILWLLEKNSTKPNI